MAEMFDLSDCRGQISVLDPGAGTGMEELIISHPARNMIGSLMKNRG